MSWSLRYLLVLLIACAASAEARPVSYSGGSTLMAFFNDLQDSVYFHYSPTHQYALGAEYVRDKLFNQNYVYLRSTFLLHRNNTDDSQSNLYVQAGFRPDGFERYFLGVQGDWETRRLYAAFGYQWVGGDIKDHFNRYLQLGFAPYLGDYGDLHTWIMVKSKNNTLTDEWSTYPVLRFFKGSAFLEVGYDPKGEGEWDIHVMYRF